MRSIIIALLLALTFYAYAIRNDRSYRIGLEDGLQIGRTEAYEILRHRGKDKAENYYMALKNRIKDRGLFYPLEIIERKPK